MLTLVVRVPDGYSRTAMATLRDGSRTVLKDFAVAVPLAGLGQQHGNPTGDPLRPFGPVPRGDYSLVALAPTPADGVAEYGAHLLAFEPQSGPALDAESFGRLVLLAYAGPSGRELRLRRTQGGLRLTVAMVNAIVSKLTPDTDLLLRVEGSLSRHRRGGPSGEHGPRTSGRCPTSHRASWYRRSTKKRWPRTPSGTAGAGTCVGTIPTRDTWRDPTPGGSTSASDTRPGGERGTPFETGGGRFGGAGATGGWDADPARPPGVDSAGRIVGAAATAAAAAAAIGLSGVGQGDASAATEPASATAPDPSTEVRTSY